MQYWGRGSAWQNRQWQWDLQQRLALCCASALAVSRLPSLLPFVDSSWRAPCPCPHSAPCCAPPAPVACCLLVF